MSRSDLGAEHNTCEACGDPIPSRVGIAFVCGPAGDGSVPLPAPRFCVGRECREARDRVAIDRAVAAGLIDP